jgi:hypothetical protein
MGVWFVALIVLLLTGLVGCDEGFYVDSVAAFSANSQTNLVLSPQVLNEIRTSNVYNAETSNNIRITYVGTFSNSGPHSLGPFARGSTNNIAIQLSRKIGDLKKVILENSGTDGWLMTTLYCQIGRVRYELRAPSVWLESMDPTSEALYEDPFSPDAQRILPSTSRMELDVVDQYYIYSSTGIVPDTSA